MKSAMKKTLLALSLSVAMVGAHAGTTQDAAGCGVGTMIFKDKSGLVYGLMAVTTNGSFSNGLISQTFGLLNCPESTSIKGKVATFIDFNKQQLAVETAQGQGEHLAALVDMYGVKESDRAAAISALKANQASIFSGSSTAEIQAAVTQTLQAFVS